MSRSDTGRPGVAPAGGGRRPEASLYLLPMRELDAAFAELREEWGVQLPLVAPVIRSLASGQSLSVDQLIAESGLSHRSTTDVLRRLEPWLHAAGGRYTLVRGARSAALATVGGKAALRDDDLLETVTHLVGDVPARKRDLDHVAATPVTCVARAKYLAEHYDLSRARVLCLGDHDLTSLALALIAPAARVSVIDMDDDLLEYIDRSARTLDRHIICHFADLRLGLSREAVGGADLVFTDPPYTPEGIRLFAVRGCEALARTDHSRLILCYGYGERQAGLGLRVQSSLHALRLVYEAVLPRFNRYLGAWAIGSASALYVLRPSAATWRATEREPDAPTRLYSHGTDALEASRPALPGPVRDAVRKRLSEAGGGWLAGEGWTETSGAAIHSLAAVWRLFERHASAAPARRPALPAAVAVNLVSAPALAVRFLLVGRSPQLLLAVPDHAARDLLGGRAWLARLLGAAYDLREAVSADGVTLVAAVARTEPADADGATGSLARDLVRHPAGTVANVLREALVRAGASGGRRLTRNEARALLDEHLDLEAAGATRPPELPLHALREVAEALETLAAACVYPGTADIQDRGR